MFQISVSFRVDFIAVRQYRRCDYAVFHTNMRVSGVVHGYLQAKWFLASAILVITRMSLMALRRQLTVHLEVNQMARTVFLTLNA